MAKTGRKKNRVSVKQMKFRNDPMIRFYEKTQDWLQDRGRPLVIGLGVLAGLVVLYVAGSYYFQYRESKAATAFSQAMEKYKVVAQISPNPTAPPNLASEDQAKWQDAAGAFDRLAKDYSGYYGTIGRYYAGVCYLHFDPATGVSQLQEAANKNEQPTSDLARLALAEYYAAQADKAEVDKSIPIYTQLLTSSTALTPAIQYAMGKAYEKLGNTQAAADAYFEAASNKQSPSATRQEASERLKALAPDRMKNLPPVTDTGFEQ